MLFNISLDLFLRNNFLSPSHSPFLYPPPPKKRNRRLRGAAPILYVILVRKPRNEQPRYTVSRCSRIFSHLGHFVVRRDPHLFDLGTRGWEAHTFLCLEEGTKPEPGVFGFDVKLKRSNVLQNQNLT